ncbi:MAG: flagellar biosynthesis protein FlhB [Cellvibrionales bacterium]|nr:flagellar biosynthesis protein FlhB [Porticoccaceae bacterium]|tara:strand:- start:11214 stop:12359 length:1146 start_codon:yes stop_codon:yes gene_type:complete
MAEESSEEKSEEPTAKRLEKARDDGQVARSQELGVALMMVGAAIFMYMFGGIFVGGLTEAFSNGFVFDRQTVFSESRLPAEFGSQGLTSMMLMLPFFGLTMFIAAASGGVLGGYIFSLKAVAPKASKLNPMSGLKRMFGAQALIGLTKALLKFSLVGGVLFLVVSQRFDTLIYLGLMDLKPALQEAGALIAFGAVLVTLALLVPAAIDVPYQLWEFNKKMKMTKQEVKDEMKDTEGRPEVKAQIRRKQREMSMGSMIQAVAEADVVIVNPEHFAVALSYDPTSNGAPLVVAKGADFMAQAIRDKAKESGVPLFSSPSLARAIYFTTEITQAVPESLYYAVAQVIAYVFGLNSLNRGSQVAQKPSPKVPKEMRYDKEGKREE